MRARVTVLVAALLPSVAQSGEFPSPSCLPDTDSVVDRTDADLVDLFEGDEQTRGYESDLLAQIDDLREHPFDLNSVTLEELQSIPGVQAAEANAILALRRSLTRFISVSQLLLLKEQGQRIMRILSPFVFVRSRGKESGAVRLRSRVRADTRTPEPDRTELGTPFTLLERLSLRPSPETAMELVVEKEAGERFSESLVAGSLDIRLPGSRIVLGDFVAEGGQGLVFWRSRYSPKGGRLATDARRLSRGVRPSVSPGGAGRLRGIALTAGATANRGLTCSLFASRRSIDGTLDEAGTLTSVDETGLFRTEEELRRRSVASERLIGGRASYSMADDIVAGITLSRSWLDRPVVTDTRTGEHRSVFEAIGVDAMVGMGPLQVFGEAARSGGYAFLVGTMFGISRRGSVVMLWRQYQGGFVNRHAGGFGENGETRNERGFYVGWELPIGETLTVSGSYDQYRYPGGTHASALPSGGNDCTICVKAPFLRDGAVSLRISRRCAEVVASAASAPDHGVPPFVVRASYGARVALELQVGRMITLATRAEGRSIRQGTEHETGLWISQELRIRPAARISARVTVTVFEAGMDGSPFYRMDGDVPGAYSSAALVGNGRRSTGVVQWHIASWLELSAKYATTESVAAGAERPGSLKKVFVRNVAAQLDIRL